MSHPECVFCAIVARTEPAHIIYEDERAIAFMDIRPHNPGHTLVIPKQHIPHFIDMGDDLYLHCMSVAKQISRATYRALKPRRVGLALTGFEVPHTHIHIVPLMRFTDMMTLRMIRARFFQPPYEALGPVADQLRGEPALG